MKDIFSTNEERRMRYTIGNLVEISQYPVKTDMGVYMVVVSGTAILNAGSELCELQPETEASFISGGVFQCLDSSPDFMVRMFVYSSELFAKIALPIDPIFFDYNEAHPIYQHTPDKRSRTTWREVLLWMDMAEMLFSDDASPRFVQLQEEVFLQGFWMWNFGTIQERISTHNKFATTQLIAHKFMSLARSEAIKQHQVGYYADRLNISQRYLNKIVWRHTRGRTPKQIIDSHLIAEVKVRLMDASLSITQVAQMFNFPDQSALSRFFRRHTGLSPHQYRTSRSVHWNFNEER